MKLRANSLKIIITFTSQQCNSTVSVQFIIEQSSYENCVCTDALQHKCKISLDNHFKNYSSNFSKQCCYYLQLALNNFIKALPKCYNSKAVAEEL